MTSAKQKSPDGTEPRQSPGELQWPRGGYRILTVPEGVWREQWDALRRRDVEPGDGDPPAPWVFDQEEFRTAPPGPYGFADQPQTPWGAPLGTQMRVFRIDWPSAGVFAPAEGSVQERYHPMDVAHAILLDVQRTPARDAKALLRFVNRWGVLGVGIPGAADFGADGVNLTGDWLARLAQWIETFHALTRGRATGMTWATFATTLNDHLGGVHPILGVTEHGLHRTFAATRLLDALCFKLWDQAAERQRLRRCPECRALFLPGRTNQEYCTRLCANRPTVRKWKRAQKRKKTLADREKEA